ncbi:MAG TPA: hypothetical protein VGS62_05675, partial [Streptosporangiaceae bacterium]|nr:hypothetical protein [Streptosporangiaceae bacterium]
MASFRKWAARRWYAVLAVGSVPLMIAGLFLASSAPGNASLAPGAVGSTHYALAKTGHAAAGHMVHAAVSSKPFAPTAAQKAVRARDM